MNHYLIYYYAFTKKWSESRLWLDAQRTYVNHFYFHKTILAEFVEIKSVKIITNHTKLQKAITLCQHQDGGFLVAKIDQLS